MLNTIQNLIRIPQNDAQLNVLVNSINKSYGKYFNFEVGAKRSNNLRDCYCEHMGFTNGAYSQLQQYWEANRGYDFTDIDMVAGIFNTRTHQYAAVVPVSIAHDLYSRLCQFFPQSSEQGFLDQEQYDDVVTTTGHQNSDLGWRIKEFSESTEQAFIKKVKEEGNWHPLYYGQMVIGFSWDLKEALLLNGILRSFAYEKKLDVTGSGTGRREYFSANIKWQEYVKQHSELTHFVPGKYFSLRMSGMEESILIPFNEAVIVDNEINITDSATEYKITHNKDMVVFNDIEFDFITFYDFNESKESKLELITGKKTKQEPEPVIWTKTKKDVNFVEWFPQDRTEYMWADGDDVLAIDHEDELAILIK